MIFTESLRKNLEFKYVYSHGKSYANRYLVMYVMNNNSKKNRIGISVSKKVGNSVIRHHVKRLIKESYRLHEEMFNSSLDIVIIARTSAADADFRQIESALLHVANLHKIIS
ncbi:MAG: ribonuclease P protein component [Lachnospiraceae bacterium]|nr:ribonuclease P protein component [Lachnospiraceae bacterium]